MKKSKRYVSLFLAAVFILATVFGGCFTAAASGDGTHKITFKSQQGLFSDITGLYSAGDEFGITLNLKAENRITAFFIEVNTVTSPKEAKITSCSASEIIQKGAMENADTNGYLISFADIKTGVDCTEGGEFLTLKGVIDNSFTTDQVLNVDFQTLGGDAGGSSESYIARSSVVAANKDKFSFTASRVGGQDISETTPATQATSTQQTTAQQTTAQQTQATSAATNPETTEPAENTESTQQTTAPYNTTESSQQEVSTNTIPETSTDVTEAVEPTSEQYGTSEPTSEQYGTSEPTSQQPGTSETVAPTGNHSFDDDKPLVTDKFVWGVDNYNFNNYAPSYFKNSTYRAQINNTYLNKLNANMNNCEFQSVFLGDWVNNGWLDDEWDGSCYGMSSTTLLAKQGLLPYSDYKEGAACLNDMDYPKNNLELSSLITYYQMLQAKDIVHQQYRTVPYRSNEENITTILKALDENPLVIIGYQKEGWGGHAVLATGYEAGSWKKNGVSYGGCIKICDPNCSEKYNEDYNIYFNTSTYNWIIPAYSAIKSTQGAAFNFISASIKEINDGGYLSGAVNKQSDNYVSRLNAPIISDNCSVTKVKSNSTGDYTPMHSSFGDIVEDYEYWLGGDSKGVRGYNLYDSAASYKITQDTAQELKVSIEYPNCRMSASSAAGKSVVFDRNGIVKLEGEQADYNLTWVFNEEYPTDWFTVMVAGNGTDPELYLADNGYVLKSDNLHDIRVQTNNRTNYAAVKFSTNYDSALIYEINEKVIGIKVDADNNGSYETDLENVEMMTEPTTDAPVIVQPTESVPENPTTAPTEPSENQNNPSDNQNNPSINNDSDDDGGISVDDIINKITSNSKKKNTLKVTAAKKTLKASKLVKKNQTIKLKIKNAKGKVKCKLVKKGTTKKIYKYLKVNKKGVITFKRWKKAKKGNYKIKVKVTAAGNKTYYSGSKTVNVKLKIK